MIKSSQKINDREIAAVNILQSQVLSQPEEYEIEVEFLGYQNKDDEIELIKSVYLHK